MFDNLSLKAIGAGVALALVVSVLLAYMAPIYLNPIYDHIVAGSPSGRVTSHRLLLHPLMLAVTLVSSILQVGIPGYLAAWVADWRFVLHSVAVALIFTIVTGLVAWDGLLWVPLLFLALTVSNLVIAVSTGLLRQYQTRNRVKRSNNRWSGP